MSKGLSISKKTVVANSDESFMAEFAILCLLGDAMEEAIRDPEETKAIAINFFKAAVRVWPNGGLNLIRSTQYMAEDLGFAIELDRNVKIATA